MSLPNIFYIFVDGEDVYCPYSAELEDESEDEMIARAPDEIEELYADIFDTSKCQAFLIDGELPEFENVHSIWLDGNIEDKNDHALLALLEKHGKQVHPLEN